MRTRAVDVAVCPPLGLFPDYIAEMATLTCLMHYSDFTVSDLQLCLPLCQSAVIEKDPTPKKS